MAASHQAIQAAAGSVRPHQCTAGEIALILGRDEKSGKSPEENSAGIHIYDCGFIRSRISGSG